MELEQLHALLEETTQSLPGTLTAETDLTLLDGWDSMGIVLFIDTVTARVGVELAVHELRGCTYSPDVLELIRRGL